MPLELYFREKSSFLTKLLHILDCLLVVGMLRLSVEIHQVPWSEFYSSLAVGSFILCFLSFYSVKLYRPWRGIKLYKELFTILKAWMIFASIVLSIFFLFKISDRYSRMGWQSGWARNCRPRSGMVIRTWVNSGTLTPTILPSHFV